MCNKDDNCKCISEILTVICLLQQNSSCNDNCLETCDKGFLGASIPLCNYNTRPIMLFTCDGKPLCMPTSKEDDMEDCSNVFRIEKIDGCCATFRVLQKNNEPIEDQPYIATNSFFTTNLNCICCIKCLKDTYIECV